VGVGVRVGVGTGLDAPLDVFAPTTQLPEPSGN
jgi:hypothetical protein